MFCSLKNVANVRSLGTVFAFDIVSQIDRVGYEIYKEGLKSNLVLRPLGNTIYLYLPLCVSQSDMEEIIVKTYSLISDVIAT